MCLSAILPESGRIVARSTGQNPSLVERRHDGMDGPFSGLRHLDFCERQSAWGLSDRREPSPRVNQRSRCLPPHRLARTNGARKSAIPIIDIEHIGFISAERVRVPRPDAPELRWNWPGANRRLAYQLASGDAELAPPAMVERVSSA